MPTATKTTSAAVTHNQIKMRWIGTRPLLVHNGRLANPLDDMAKAMKGITGKRKKTDEDLMELQRLEWRGGLYYDERITPDTHVEGLGPVMPGVCIDATIVSAAKLSKMGATTKRGVMVSEDSVAIEYAGPRDPDKMWESGNFHDTRTVRNQANRVVRCRPKFTEWAITFTVEFDSDVINRQDLIDICNTAGNLVGLCDYRPRYGRFSVEVL